MSKNLPFLARYYVRKLLFMKIYGRLYGYFLQRQSGKWNELYKSIEGHDTWLVVGNGPSLRIADLEAFYRLGIPSIASNKINLVFDQTEWRPALSTIADPLLLEKLPPEHYRTLGRVLLPHTHVLMARTKNSLPWRHLLDAEGEKAYDGTGKPITPLNGFFVGGTITCPNLELAIWAGAKTIYLIGCDHFYKNEDSKEVSRTSAHSGSSNHFHPDYRKPGELVNEAPVGRMNFSYSLMQRLAEQRGIKIVNISRQSAIEAFERDTVENTLAKVKENSAAVVAG